MKADETVYVGGLAAIVREAGGDPVLVHVVGEPYARWVHRSKVDAVAPSGVTEEVKGDTTLPLSPGELRSIALEVAGYESDPAAKEAGDAHIVDAIETALAPFADGGSQVIADATKAAAVDGGPTIGETAVSAASSALVAIQEAENGVDASDAVLVNAATKAVLETVKATVTPTL